MTQQCPTEFVEESRLSNYCDLKGYVHWHVPQETFTTSWNQKRRNKAQGVREGVSDHWIIVPYRDKHILMVVELKRQHGNTPSDAQIQFLHDINKVDNVLPVCCYGADEVIAIIEELQENRYDTLDKCGQRLKNLENKRKTAKKRKNPTKSVKIDENDCPF